MAGVFLDVEEVVRSAYKDRAQDFVCNVCLGLWFDPVQTKKCNHVMCKTCATGLERCPTCRLEILAGDLQPLVEANPFVWRMLNQVQVCCPYRYAEEKHSSQHSHGSPTNKRRRVDRQREQCAWTGCYDTLNP